jgi:4'-phosphopantetheinyl transferase
MQTLLSSSHVDLWLYSIHPHEHNLSELFSILSQAEQEKAKKFHFASDRKKYVISHGIMRRLLASYIECEPLKIHYQVNEYGKPSMSTAQTPIHFNLTHSDNLAGLAIASSPVGVDIEKIKPLDDYLSMTKHFLSPKESLIFQSLAQQEQQLTFYRAWTRKEAYIKAIGMGLSYPVEQVTVGLQEKAELLEDQANPANISKWSLFSFEYEGYIGAITIPKNNQYEIKIIK